MAFKKFEKEERDHHLEITEKIIKSMEESLKWEKPFFNSNHWPENALTGERYKGSNVTTLLVEGYNDPRWLTYVQMGEMSKELGKPLHLERGSKAAYISKVIPVYEKVEMMVEGPDGKMKKEKVVKKDSNGKPIPVLDEQGNPKISFKFYPVFNASQVVGLEPFQVPNNKVEPHESVEILSKALQERTGLVVEHGNRSEAYYQSSAHKVYLPFPSLFKSDAAYADTALHEFGHSTGPALGRKMGNQFGSEAYAYEELVAELNSAFMAAELGIPHNPSSHENHAAYVQSWIKALKNDKMLIFKASSQASKATEFQMGHFNAYKEQLEQKDAVKVSEAEAMAKQLMANLTAKPTQVTQNSRMKM